MLCCAAAAGGVNAQLTLGCAGLAPHKLFVYHARVQGPVVYLSHGAAGPGGYLRIQSLLARSNVLVFLVDKGRCRGNP